MTTTQSARVLIGSAPDSWGVWFPDDPAQIPPERFLDEVAAAGYRTIELGPYGYLPTDPGKLRDLLMMRGLNVSAGTVVEYLHRPGSWDDVWAQITDVAALTHAVGGQHLVVIPDTWRDHKTGAAKENRELDAEQWMRMTSGMEELGRRVLTEYDLTVQFHPHADSHVSYQHDIERFLANTNPSYVNLCLDTGHVSYYDGDNIELIRRFPERIGYLHLKQVSPTIAARVVRDDLPFSDAVRLGVMVEPPHGVPDLAEVLHAAADAGLDVYGIVEQDMYPCPPEQPLPIAQRTFTYLTGCGVPAVRLR